MKTIAFRDGTRMDWNSYRMLMRGEISPFRAVGTARVAEAARDAA
jgi:hypothetical protein